MDECDANLPGFSYHRDCISSGIKLKTFLVFGVSIMLLSGSRAVAEPSRTAQAATEHESEHPMDTTFNSKRGMVATATYFSVVDVTHKRSYISSTTGGAPVGALATKPSHRIGTPAGQCLTPVDWYAIFRARVADSFDPEVAGGTYTYVSLAPGRVKSIKFICFEVSPTRPKATLSYKDSVVLKESVSKALNTVMHDPTLPFPPGIESIDVWLGFAGDPLGGSFGLDDDCFEKHKNGINAP